LAAAAARADLIVGRVPAAVSQARREAPILTERSLGGEELKIWLD
jgi:hypothetical protein